jgi:hypothetical protein
MGYVVGYSTSSISNTRRRGNVVLGVDSDGYDKTSVSGLYAGVAPVPGKHNIVRTPATGDPDFYSLSNSELINFANQLGGGVSSVTDATYYLSTQDDIMFINDIPNDTELGNLLFDFDFSNESTYPGSGVVYYDLSGNNYHASASSDTTYVEYDSNLEVVNFGGGEVGGHGLFIQDLNYISGDSDKLEELTIDTLVKNSSTSVNSSDQRIILSFDRSAVFRFMVGGDNGGANNPGRMSFAFIHGTDALQVDVSSGTSYDLRDDQWHRIALTFKSGSGNGIKYYVDGEQVYHDTTSYGAIGEHNEGETPRYGVIGAGSEKTNGIPGSSTAPDAIFTGSMASIKYYNKQLSQSEILQNYYGGPIVTDGLIFAVDAGNLVSYESGSTTAYNMTGSNDLSLKNGLEFNLNYGGYFDSDGTNDGLDTPDTSNLDVANNFTVEGWVWWNQHKNYGSLLVKGPGGSGQLFNYSFFFYQSIIRVGFGDGSGYKSNSINVLNVPINQWHHILGTYDGANLKFYVNGNLINTVAHTTTPYQNSDNLNVVQSAYPIDGRVAIARVYNKALTSDEVLQNYNAQKSRFL